MAIGPDVYVTPPTVPGDLGGGDGSPTHPFHSVAAGTAKAKANGGGIVRLHGGHYVESVRLENFGEDGQEMVVRADGGGEVFIDSMLPEFLAPKGPDDHWYEVIPPVGPFMGEYYWRRRYMPPGADESVGLVHMGAFLDEPVHTRLVSYDRVEDLTATGQVWPDHAVAGNRVWRAIPGQPGMYTPEERADRAHYRPWVYMGPGIWFDEAVRDDTDDVLGGRRVHIRLSPTANNIPGWPDYDPVTTDPNQVRLALCREGDRAIFLKKVSHVRFENLTLRYGNPETVRLNSCTDIVFDHCRIRSGGRALFLLADDGPNEHIRVEHCVIDGGIPTWLFRSDRKDNYVFGSEPNPPETATASLGELSENRLGSATSSVQLSSTEGCVGMIVHHCEIFNAHDSYVFGDKMEFHHNWVHNLNDDGIALSADAETKNAKIYCNVMTQCLTALSFAPTRAVGPVYIYGNLFDIRAPTLGKRPTGEETSESLRQGHFFKDGANEGPVFLFHNTCLVFDPGAIGDDLTDLNRVGFAYYSTIGTSDPRPAYNNIFVAAFTPVEDLKPIAFLPPDGFGPTDGNTYLRIPHGSATDDNFIVWRKVDNHMTDNFSFPGLDEYQAQYWPNDETHEYEHDGQLGDPGFKSFDTVTGRPHRGDDLRLRFHPKSPAKGTAVEMPEELAAMYFEATGTAPTDRGCYPFTGAILQVGVDGRMVYPWMRPGPRPDTHPDDVAPPAIENG
jgi:hypothetical protein